MSTLKIFAIYDAKAKAYLRPFCLPEVIHAIREIGEVLTRPCLFSDYPENFTLFEIGSYDEISGEVSPLLMHESHGNLLSIRSDIRARRATTDEVVSELRLAFQTQATIENEVAHANN